MAPRQLPGRVDARPVGVRDARRRDRRSEQRPRTASRCPAWRQPRRPAPRRSRSATAAAATASSPAPGPAPASAAAARPPAPPAPARAATPPRPRRSTPGPGRRRAAARIRCIRVISMPPSSPARRLRRAPQCRPQQPPGPVGAAFHRALRYPNSSATSATGRSSTYISRHTSRSGLPAGPQGGDRARPGRPGPGQLPPGHRPAAPVRREHGGQHHCGGPAAAQQQRGLTPGHPPQPSARPRPPAGSRPRPATPPGTSPASVLDVRGGQHRPQPDRQPRRMPREQLPQRGVVTAPPPQRSAHRRPSLLYCVLPATGSPKRRDSFLPCPALPCSALQARRAHRAWQPSKPWLDGS